MDFVIERGFDGEARCNKTTFRGSFTDDDIAILQLDTLDRALLRDTDNMIVADYLLALEMLYRRHAEQTNIIPAEAGDA